jgi:hypothetical protein
MNDTSPAGWARLRHRNDRRGGELADLGRRRLLYGVGAGAALAITGHASTAQAAVTTNAQPTVLGWANVRDYGAAGNGTTDDTDAINAAIQAVTGSAAPATSVRFPAAGVYLPPGIYRVTSDLLIQSVEGFAFAGAGAEITILLASGRGFTTAVLNIDGSAKGGFRGFSIAGDGTEGSGNQALPNAINLTWTTAARRSTTANSFGDIYVRGLKFACGMRMGAPSGTTRQVDGTTISDVIIAGAGTAGYPYTSLYLYGFYFGNGVTGNQYNYVVHNSSAAGCRIAVCSDASGFEWYGGQPAQNAIEFYFAGAPVQATIQGIQSQDSGQFLNVTGGSATATVSVRDVLFNTAHLVSSKYWIEVKGIARGWEFSNVRASTGTASPIIFFSGSGNAEVATLINVAQQNTAAAGIVVQSGGSVKLVNYMQLNSVGQVTAVWHDFIKTAKSAYACTQSDRYVLADATAAAFTVTLPNASLCPGKAYTVKKTDSTTHAVTVAPSTRQTIDGTAAYQLRSRYSAVDLVSDGSGWFVTAKL